MLTTTRRDTRSAKRFPLKLTVAYRVFPSRGSQVLGHGKSRTIDISSTGVLLRTRGHYPAGASAELLIDWPASRENAPAAQLRIFGAVVRHDERGTAIEIFRHGFQDGALRIRSATGLARVPSGDMAEHFAEEPSLCVAAG